MIIVHGTIPVRPEHLEEALRLARIMTEQTHKEPGCISYDFYVGLTDPSTLMLFQEWEDMDSLMAHFQTSHMEEFLSQLPDLLSGEITTRRYAVQSMNSDEEEDDTLSPPPVIH
ncbi:MAG: putative quinol monooxygenase [Pseudomonadales bacterium]|nr:putative quinol monooxygenase [Pseudomonadales bacterium]MDP6470978.1 putative quinol monooxygenase [Pseudomonadales bacterium]MDP6825837.1 putative quinol monooxygenase [Pseudomonadales bacterium]MDP6972443.1 putative quinol monooxygenase [Pseudomonadales bacterium]